uniref:CSON013248 protein n=1 Tax=Culicoides sonorensis TaxID=179676 RepID=A0A336M7R1_CULSO
MILKSLVLCSVILIIGIEALSTEDSPTYIAGAVEYEKIRYVTQPRREADENLNEYTKIILAPETKDVDILVFPESSLNNIQTAAYVPDPKNAVIPCDLKGKEDIYDVMLKNVSCAAQKTKKYVLINLTEKSDCIESSETSNCPEDKIKRYNTNVVFDRNGAVISTYRKVNLFGEAGISRPDKPESIPFKTDFGVTFGQFICFDLMFEKPAVELARSGITDFLFSTMWFSELPFLSAVQAQLGWAYKHGVNFIGSGASFPLIGSTGTGIYHGKFGALDAVMNYISSTKVYIAEVPKIGPNSPAPSPSSKIQRYDPVDMLKLKLKRDQLDVYNTTLINFSASKQTHEICHDGFCCNFNLNIDVLPDKANQDSPFYLYRMAAYNGLRTFDGFADGAVKVCAIFACTDDTLASCGKRHTMPVHDKVQFNSIELKTVYDKMDNTLFMPNTLDASIMPFESTEYEYEERAREDGKIEIYMKLLESKTDLLTFAIYSRNFDRDPVKK